MRRKMKKKIMYINKFIINIILMYRYFKLVGGFRDESSINYIYE